jgi:uroporphyrinogen-III synthase
MKRIVVTRARAQANGFAEKLSAAGFEPVFFPVIEIRPIENNLVLERALAKLDCYDWIVFTSVNAVEVVFHQLQKPLPLRVAAIGPKTAEALLRLGVTPDFVPEEYVAESILPGLGDVRGKWILLPRAEIARKALPEAIAERGGIAHEIPVYQTLPAEPDATGLSVLRSGVDWITFTSPSTVQNFVEILRQRGMDPLRLTGDPQIACIGPITEQAAREEGFPVKIVAEQYTTDGLIRALQSV